MNDTTLPDEIRYKTIKSADLDVLLAAASRWADELGEYVIPALSPEHQSEELSARNAEANAISEATDRVAALPLTEPALTPELISAAANRAADEIIAADLDELEEPEARKDLVNLTVNAALHMVENPEDSLRDAILANYDDDFAAELISDLGL